MLRTSAKPPTSTPERAQVLEALGVSNAAPQPHPLAADHCSPDPPHGFEAVGRSVDAVARSPADHPPANPRFRSDGVGVVVHASQGRAKVRE
jgi:hypothetical protein